MHAANAKDVWAAPAGRYAALMAPCAAPTRGLFVEGRQRTSQELSQQLQQWMNGGVSHLVLVIGAAEGMPSAVAEQIREKWSLSKLTFSHQLIRLLLLEALYRSFDMLHGGRYHK